MVPPTMESMKAKLCAWIILAVILAVVGEFRLVHELLLALFFAGNLAGQREDTQVNFAKLSTAT